MKAGEVALSVVLALTLLAAPLPADAQQSGKVYRIGWLGTNIFAPTEEFHPDKCPMTGRLVWQAWVAGLRERGYIPGQNLVLDCRFTQGRDEQAPDLAKALVSLTPDLLVASSTANVRAAKQATSTLPILMVGVINPVERGLVPNLTRPGGNVTGVTSFPMTLEGKRLQLLKEVVPQASRVALLSKIVGGPSSGLPEEMRATTQALGLTTTFYNVVQAPEEIAGAFAAMTKAQEQALLVIAHPFWYSNLHRVIQLAAQHRLPAIYADPDFVPAGGLMVYSEDAPAIFRRLGGYADKIFKGANPGDLPVEQPTKFYLLINLKTAKALGLTIPRSLIMRADEVIE